MEDGIHYLGHLSTLWAGRGWFEVQSVQVMHALQLTLQLLSSFIHTMCSSLFHREIAVWASVVAAVPPDD